MTYHKQDGIFFFLKLAEKLSHSFLFSELGEYYSHDIQYTDCVTPFSFSLKKIKKIKKQTKYKKGVEKAEFLYKIFLSLQLSLNGFLNGISPNQFLQRCRHKLRARWLSFYRTCILRVSGINPILQKQFPSLFRTLKVLLSIFCVHDLLKTIDLYFILLLLLFTKFGYNQLNTRF